MTETCPDTNFRTTAIELRVFKKKKKEKKNMDKMGKTFLGITRYGSTLYIGIAMVFVFSPYIRKFSSYFHFQVIVTFNDFIALNV